MFDEPVIRIIRTLIIPPGTKGQGWGVNRTHSFVRMSVSADSFPVLYSLLDIGIHVPYLAHECIIMKHHETICCVHSWSWYDVDLQVRFNLLFVLADHILHIGLSQEACNHYIDMTLTFELKVKFIGLLT